jgi:sec-independent protein translocase protein TatA
MGLDNPIHIAFLLVMLLLVFGAKRLPEMGRSLGGGMRGFKDSLSSDGAQASMTAQPTMQSVAQPTRNSSWTPETQQMPEEGLEPPTRGL